MFLETIKIVNGELQNLKFHQQRIKKTLLNFAFNDEVSQNLINFDFPKIGEFRYRIVYREKILKREIFPIQQRIFKKLSLAFCNSIKYNYKFQNREKLDNLKKRFLNKSDEIIIVKNGFLTDTTISNLAFYNGKLWVTPKNPLLKGTIRELFLQQNKIKEEFIQINELKNFKKVALLNALLGFYIINHKFLN